MKPDGETGQPGMALWQILVLSVLKQGLSYDYDRLQELANQQHLTVLVLLVPQVFMVLFGGNLG